MHIASYNIHDRRLPSSVGDAPVPTSGPRSSVATLFRLQRLRLCLLKKGSATLRSDPVSTHVARAQCVGDLGGRACTPAPREEHSDEPERRDEAGAQHPWPQRRSASADSVVAGGERLTVPVGSAAESRVALVCNSDAFRISETDSATNRESITILQSSFGGGQMFVIPS